MNTKCKRFAADLCRLLPLLAVVSCSLMQNNSGYAPKRTGAIPGETITVAKNQNIYAIAQEHNVSMRDIIVLNGLQAPYTLNPGQSLVLPFRRDGASPSFASGTPPFGSPSSMPMGTTNNFGVSSAPLGGVSSATLPPIEAQSLPPLGEPTKLVPLSETTPTSLPPVTTATKPAPMGKTALTTTLTPPSAMESLNAPSPTPKSVTTTIAPQVVTPPANEPEPSSDSREDTPGMMWPVKGPVLSSFGAQAQGARNDGVNIGAPKGSPVVAALNGIVVYSGNDMKGFGNLILIRHEDNWITAYAHLERILVKKDAAVAKGDMIGTIGKTGNITSPQLHFETRHNGKPVNPKSLIH